jgi:signal transduction histidine kinase
MRQAMPPAGGAAVLLALLLLTWMSVRAINPEAELFDRALETLDKYAMMDSALRRDVLTARAGLLRNYDPLVQEVDALNQLLGRLRDTAAVDEETAASIDRLAGSASQEEELVEQFKSDNALLQNSLAHFGLFSAGLAASDPIRPSAFSALATAMLALTLNTSAATARSVEDALNRLARQPPSADPELVRLLLAHGRMLHDLLPATDATLKALIAVPSRRDQKELRAVLVARQADSRTTARRFRFLLYATSLLLLGVLVHLGLRLRARAVALQRYAAFEHAITCISTRFISARPQEIAMRVEQALAELAERIGADRAYFVLAGTPPRVHAWCREGIKYPPGWPDQALALSVRFDRTQEGIIHIPRVTRLAPGEDKDLLVAAGLRGWACVPRTDGDGVSGVLGFDLPPECRITSGELGLLRLALDALTNAVRRELLERERTRLEMRLQQARRMETVGTLASGVAHNFNNIIGAILGHVEMADEQVASDSRTARSNQAIRRAGERARDLVDQILTFSRRRDAHRQAVSVQALISEAAALLRASLPSSIELVIRDAPQAAVVSGQYVQLQQVILNFCSNAAQAMDESGPVEIETEMHEIASVRSLTHGQLAPGRYVRVTVSDTGRGMSDAIIERIFEPFFTTRPAGYGLGLATVREIVREHAGAMNVMSTPGVGSRFEVWLPCIASPEAAPREDESALQLGRGETLLVVDDDRQRLLAIEDMLAALGYEPVGFLRAGDALAACRATPQRFDALMVGHPILDVPAFELAAALHEIAPRLPLLLMTASAEEVGVDALAAGGISEVVRRPLVCSEIAAALSRCLAAGQSARSARSVDHAFH